MSYQNGTTHFNLPQTVGSDKRDWFDTNEAFRDIDEAIHTAVVDSGTALDQIEQVSTDVSAVDTKADSIGDRVTTIEGKQATDEENIAQNAQAISRVESKVDELDTDLAEMIEVTEEESATATVQHTVGSYFRYNDNLWVTTILIRVGDEIVPNVNCETTDVMTRVYALEQGGTPVEDVIDDTAILTDRTWSSSKINTELSAKADDSDVNAIETQLKANNSTAGVTDVPFRFGCTDDGDYGYILTEGGADTVIPFKSLNFASGVWAGINGGARNVTITKACNAYLAGASYGFQGAGNFSVGGNAIVSQSSAYESGGGEKSSYCSGYCRVLKLKLQPGTLTITPSYSGENGSYFYALFTDVAQS